MDDVRTQGIEPGRRRLALGLTSVIGREDGSVVEVFPDGSEKVLEGPDEAGRREAVQPNIVDDRTE